MADGGPAIDIIGLHGGVAFGAQATSALAAADLVMGARRHLAAVTVAPTADTVELPADLDAALDRLAAARAAGSRVCLLASGDPGFFGIGRRAAERLGPGNIRVHPAPSSVAMAFGRAGVHWDDAVVVSAHGRDAGPAAEAIARHPKVAVLCAPASAPEEIGRRALAAGSGARDAFVVTRLGQADESLWRGDLGELAAGSFDPLSVVICLAGAPGGAGLAWGRPESGFRHRDGMITKAEVRAVALGKLALPAAGVLWDVGAGSGSVGIECAGLAPGLRIYAVEPTDLDILRHNTAGTGVEVVAGAAPEVLAGLPDPDRAFVGGGGIDVLDAVLARLRPRGRVVATYASPGRAVAAADRLGQMVQISVSRAVPAGATLRLAAENPVFVCWGPS
ncbi:MAG TPA: precorrin-6y C5,15-methyltransferase (decarboxylating) subunit CbiE [Acidimicrobiales bacterium]|nr:precorrin-6y C5,15-methyltransferase (decarboxylating) subunit CbiE [Acidimicrobiales bacterium]